MKFYSLCTYVLFLGAFAISCSTVPFENPSIPAVVKSEVIHTGDFLGCADEACAKILVSNGKGVDIVSLSNGERVIRFSGAESFNSHAVNDGLFACNSESTISVWNVNDGKKLPFFTVHAEFGIKTIALSKKYLVAGGINGDVAVWKIGQLKPYRKFSAKTDWVVDIDVDGNNLVAGFASGYVVRWNIKSGQRSFRFLAHEDGLLALDLKGNYLVTSGWRDHRVDLWDARSGRRERSFRIPDEKINAIAIQGNSLAAGGIVNKRIFMWDLRSGSRLGVTDFQNSIWRIVLTNDSIFASSGNNARSLRVYNFKRKEYFQLYKREVSEREPASEPKAPYIYDRVDGFGAWTK
jgi:WD40 repeat protein